MAKTNLRIEIIRSSITELSSLGAVSAEGLKNELSKYYSNVQIVIVDNVFDLASVVERKPDVVFTGIKYVYSNVADEIIWVEKYLKTHNIICTGSNAAAHEIELDKSLSKQKIIEYGLPTSAYILIPNKHTNNHFKHNLKYPLFVKPSDRGGGQGIDSFSVVNTSEELHAKVTAISLEHQSDSLVEEFLSGREFSVAILKNSDSSYLTMSLELIAPKDINGDRILSKEVKSDDTETYDIVSDRTIKNSVEKLALESFEALGARDYGRIDIRLDSAGNPQFLEANLIPSLLENYGNFPKACVLNESISFGIMLQRIVNLALTRSTIIDQDERVVNIIGPSSNYLLQPLL